MIELSRRVFMGFFSVQELKDLREALQQYYKSHLASYSEKSGTRHKRAKAASRTRVVKMGSCQEVESSKNISFSTTAVLHYISNHF